MICHETPNLLVSQPHRPGSPPSASRSQHVDLLLGLAVDEERDAVREREGRPAVQRHELLPGELELRRHHRSVAPGRGAEDLRVIEDRRLERDGLLGPAVERQEGRDLLLHVRLLGSAVSTVPKVRPPPRRNLIELAQ
jgi:hypothetical protein